MVFGRRNYLLLGLGLCIIVIGFTLMRIENAVEGVVSLYIAPLLILAGYLEIIYAIMAKPRTAKG